MFLNDLFLYKDYVINNEARKNVLKFKKNFKYENIKNNEVNITKENFEIAKKSFTKLLKQYPASYDITTFFLNAELEYISKKINIDEIDDSPILICVEKNDLNKVKLVVEHHKKLGIKYFVFIDNGSTDGTIEYLKELDNIDLIKSSTEYYTLAKEAWENRILFSYGFNRWYLIVDSDELFNYIGSEDIKIQEHIENLEKHKIRRELSFMLDMYSKNSIFSQEDDFRNDFKFFDSDTFKIEENRRFKKVTGGPRYRKIKKNGENREFMLGKYSLFYFEKGDLQSNSHFTFPFYKNLIVNPTSVLMHYKFVGNDLIKYKDIIKNGNYAGGSEDYKLYLENYEKNGELNFYYEGSEEFIDSNSLKTIRILGSVDYVKENNKETN